ncbi:MAG: hypothetical protein PHH98_00525 [Candidatus Gracilibacteria bacterium]|nr:hypothetical protein [Candidatus Gracilibacteria bacterium]
MNNINGIKRDDWILGAANSPGCDVIGANGEILHVEPLINPDPVIASQIAKAAFFSVFHDIFEKKDPYAIADFWESQYSKISIPGTVIMLDIKKQYGKVLN